jgi:hypothetical protein
MIAAAIENNIDALENIASELHAVLQLIGDSRNLTFRQGLCLAALCLERRPDVVLDLGTGRGNSAAAFSVVGKMLAGLGHDLTVHTFDTQNRWNVETLPKLDAHIPKRVVPHVGDLTEFDFDPVLKSAGSVVVFWDAHGFAVADTVLARIMPLIAERRHILACHDISDNRYHLQRRSYGGLPFWRGMDYFYNKRDTTEINIGWISTVVDQILPLTDFCFRNDIEIFSFDHEIRHELTEATRDRFFTILVPSHQPPLISMACLSMEGTRLRHYPAPEKELVLVERDFSRRGVTSLYSANLGRPEYVTRNLQIVFYGRSQPRFDTRGDAVVFEPETSRDHLASPFFEVRSRAVAAAASGDCVIILELDWPTEAGGHPTVLLQTTGFDTLARIEGGALVANWMSPAICPDGCPEQLRVALLFPNRAGHLLPRAVRVLMKTMC